MSLRSRLFRDDPKLELASVSDAGHVTLGGSGPHVQKIQLALTLIEHVVIERRELDSLYFGRSTAAAVLAYKRRRHIINTNYQIRADDIVGKMTIASLDDEMQVREAVTRPCCNCGPKTYHPMLAFSFGAGFSPAPAPGLVAPLPPPPPQQIFAVMRSVGDAVKLAEGTLAILEAVAGGTMLPADNATLATKALQTHYLCTTAELVPTARQIKGDLDAIIRVLKNAGNVFVPGVPGDPDGGGSYAYSRAVRDGKIYVNPEFLKLTEFGRKLILVHEAFHSLSASNVDWCHNPDNDGGKSYRAVPKNLRPTNAYSLSQLVLHIQLKVEKTLDVETDATADLAPP
jgi:hypothetical protein